MESLRSHRLGGTRLKSSVVSLAPQFSLLDSSAMSESAQSRSLIYGSSALFHLVVPRVLRCAHSWRTVASCYSTRFTCKTSSISRLFRLAPLFYQWLCSWQSSRLSLAASLGDMDLADHS